MLKELPSSLTGFDKTCIPASCELLLLFVAFHPSRDEIERLQSCLKQLPPRIGYAVVANDHCPGEPVDCLAADAHLFLIRWMSTQRAVLRRTGWRRGNASTGSGGPGADEGASSL